ncbi:MAG: hypothetical protein CSA81_05690 [Acidobacteria bacterium]|nr:MAG: hypothetical protein CSA81_05690 [Acidobacteriota bacterium]PIE90917.1 MAG: hypothetical protein CR997_03415 [Acidobacteriota bacterium]
MRMKKTAFSLVELMVAIAIVAIITLLSVRVAAGVLGRSNLTSELVSIKGMVNQAKGFALTHGVPVLFTYGATGITAEADFDHDGSYGDAKKETVIGTWDDTGAGAVKPVDLDFDKVNFSYTETIDHWSGLLTGLTNFSNNKFVISPLGMIEGTAGSPTSGAIFLKTDDGFLGALYLSPLGDLKTAIKEPTEANWSWND